MTLKEIIIVKGTGCGPTRLSAFDAALEDAGIQDYNLITLSSIVPPGVTVKEGQYPRKKKDAGARLYVVLSRAYSQSKGLRAVAGMGWVLPPKGDESSCGVFMEATGTSKSRVVEEIKTSLDAVSKRRFGKKASKLAWCTQSSETCKNRKEVVCAIVAAVYAARGWNTKK